MAEMLRVNQFSIQGGNWQQRPPNICVVDPVSRRHRSRGNLYILMEPAHRSDVPPSLYDEVIDAIIAKYYGAFGSMTRGLGEALQVANALLFDTNLRLDSERRAVLGLNCAVVRDDDVYIGQIGPALASLVHRGTLRRYPPDSVWLRSESPSRLELDREPPAGLRRDVQPNLFHTTLSDGDVLLLSTTILPHLAPAPEVIDAVTYTGSGSIRDSLEALAGGRDLSALIVERPEQQHDGQQSPKAAVAVGDAALSRSRKEPVINSPRAQSIGLAQTESAEVPEDEYASEEPFGRAPSTAREPRPLEEEESAGDEEDYEDENGFAPQPRERPQVDFEDLRATLSEGATRARRNAEGFLLRVLPDSVPDRPPERERGTAAVSLGGWALVGVASVIPLVVLFIVIMTRVQYEQTRQAQFDSLRASAQLQFDTAMRAEDPVSIREGLHEALDTIEEGLAFRSEDEELQALERRTLHKLDEVDVVEPLYHFTRLVDLEDDATSPTDSSRIVMHGIDAFILNRGSDRVYKFLLNDVGDALQTVDTDPVLVRKGETYAGISLGDMVDIAWMEAGGQRTLSTFVVLERAGSLLAYDPQQGIDVLPVADSDIWLKPQAIAGYYGNLYVLDPLLSRILKYMPTDNAYTNPPSDYLDPQLDVDLTGAVDLAIDGNVYVLFADGQVKKFLKGDPQSFALQGLPSPMRSPTTIFVSGTQEAEARGYVYVTDTGNERIVQFDKSGNYVRQFKAQSGEKHMENLRGIYVDEEMERMFILSGKTLWLANIPPLTGD